MCILIPLIVGLICALLGYLLGKLLGGSNDNETVDVDGYKNRISKLEADLAACKASKAKASAPMAAPAAAAVAASIPFSAAGAKAVYGKTIKENDLTLVEGIGPKIQELFHNHDVKTWQALSECSVAKCQEVLDSGGERYKIHVPGTWPRQAKLAYEGKWQELSDWQDTLDHGKE